MPDFRRGAAAVEEAATRKGGSFRPFVPTIGWRDDKEQRYVLFLTPVNELVTAFIHEWIPVGKGEKSDGETYTKYDQFVSRKDPACGEDYDDIEDRLGVKPKERTMGVAVELDPITEKDDKDRVRVTGFVVKTDSYNRKDDNGNEEEVTQPCIGIVTQAAQNFYGWLTSYDASQGPIEETPMGITRRGKDANTTYDLIPMEGREVDLAPLLDNIDGVSYIRDDLDALLPELSEAQTDEDAASLIAATLLSRRLDELADKDRYDELVGPIEEIPSKYGKKNTPAKAAPKRPARPSRRKASEAAPAEAPAEAPATSPTEATPAPAPAEDPAPSKTDRFAKLRAKVAAESK